jgi:hypothetical protein
MRSCRIHNRHRCDRLHRPGIQALPRQGGAAARPFEPYLPDTDFAALLLIFDPQGMRAEEFYGAPEDPLLWRDFRIDPQRFFGVCHDRKTSSISSKEERNTFRRTREAAALSGALLATEAALLLTGKRRREDVVTAPRASYLDLFTRTYLVSDTRGV